MAVHWPASGWLASRDGVLHLGPLPEARVSETSTDSGLFFRPSARADPRSRMASVAWKVWSLMAEDKNAETWMALARSRPMSPTALEPMITGHRQPVAVGDQAHATVHEPRQYYLLRRRRYPLGSAATHCCNNRTMSPLSGRRSGRVLPELDAGSCVTGAVRLPTRFRPPAGRRTLLRYRVPDNLTVRFAVAVRMRVGHYGHQALAERCGTAIPRGNGIVSTGPVLGLQRW